MGLIIIEIFEEEPQLGCGGLIVLLLLIFGISKCSSCSENSTNEPNVQKVESQTYIHNTQTSTYQYQQQEVGEQGAYSGKIRTSKLGKRFDATNDGTWCPTCGKHYNDGKLHHILDLNCTFEEDIDKEGLNWIRVWCDQCQDYHVKIVN
jgi:hypothetical protein